MTMAAIDSRGFPIPVFPIGTVQKVAYTGTHGAITNPVGANTRFVMLWSSTDCHFLVAGTPVADTDDAPLTAKVYLIVPVVPGVSKVSFVQQSAGGTGFVVELGDAP